MSIANISTSDETKNSEIHLVVIGDGEQHILNELFYRKPIEIYLNNVKQNSIEKSYYLPYDLNNVTLIFEEGIDSCENMFKDLINLKEIDLSNFDFSKVTKMNYMFRNCNNLEKINFGKINTSSVNDMSYLFSECKNLISIDLSYFDTSSVTNMNYIFSGCEIIKTIDVSSFNTSNVQEMEDIFSYCYELVSINVSNFDTSKVIIMKGMFYCCKKLKYLDLQNFNISSSVNFKYMFGGCKSLIYLNLKSFKIVNIFENMLFNIFQGISQNIKYCVEDLETKYLLIGDNYANCSDICFKEDRILDIEQKTCIETCAQGQFVFKGECHEKCPNNSYILLRKGNHICTDIIPENYYLDDNDGIYKECYNNCKKCRQPGNETINNCDECQNGFIFINESFVPPQNCYKKCEYYYYFNESNKYTCINECPLKYNKLIEQKNKCIDTCKNSNDYIYEYNNICLKECPINTKIDLNNNKCYDLCGQDKFDYNNICYNECPSNTYKLLLNGKKICSEIIQENYFFDNNEEIYKECYKSCKKCNQIGNETNNNCHECKDDYIFLNKSSNIPQNCYSKNEVFPYNINQYKYKLQNTE